MTNHFIAGVLPLPMRVDNEINDVGNPEAYRLGAVKQVYIIAYVFA